MHNPFCTLIFVQHLSIQESYKHKRDEYMQVLQKKEELIRQAFVQKVKEKESELTVAEQEVFLYCITYFCYLIPQTVTVLLQHFSLFRCLIKKFNDSSCSSKLNLKR